MKTIWFISHATNPPHLAVRMRTNNMSKYMAKKGYHVEIFTASTVHNTNINLITDKSVLYIENEYDGVIYNHIRTSNYKGNGISRIINMLQFPIRLIRVSKLKEVKPDVIVCNPQSVFGVIPYIISRRLKSKFITEVRDLWPESIVVYKDLSRKNPLISIMYMFEKWIYKKADNIIFTMEGGKDYIIDKGWDKDIDLLKVHNINNGVDLDVFNYNKENYQTSDPDLENNECFKVVYAGSIRVANNVKKIIDAAEQVKASCYGNIKFLIYGEGSDREYLERYCLENNIDNVIFKGHIDKNRIPYILSCCNANILHFEQNTLKKYGASLNKMFEYFASGRPTVSDCEFGYDLIKRYNCGIVIDNANSMQLADAIIKFYSMSHEEYEAYCHNAIRAAQDYDFKQLADMLEKVILEDKKKAGVENECTINKSEKAI